MEYNLKQDVEIIYQGYVLMSQKQDLRFDVKPTRQLDRSEKERLAQLFMLTYDEANLSYLEKSISNLEYIATATSGNVLAGFAVADSLETELPRLEEKQVVLRAGISCVHSDFRRKGLFRSLETKAALQSGLILPDKRILACGRMAHPASFRVLRKFSSVIPKPGVPLSEWQKETGLKIAELYDVSLDPDTFVVKGRGMAIGYPKLTFEVADEEWLPFQYVNRKKGDSLLGLAWVPEAPEGW